MWSKRVMEDVCINDASTVGEMSEEWNFKVGQLNRRSWRLLGLVVAFIAGSILYFIEMMCLRSLGTDYYGVNYGFPSWMDVFFFVTVLAIGFTLHTEWDIIKNERELLFKKGAVK